jgi:hypothetical protein
MVEARKRVEAELARGGVEVSVNRDAFNSPRQTAAV